MSHFFVWITQNPMIMNSLLAVLLLYLVIQVMYTAIYMAASVNNSQTYMTNPAIPFILFICVGVPITFIGLATLYFVQLLTG